MSLEINENDRRIIKKLFISRHLATMSISRVIYKKKKSN